MPKYLIRWDAGYGDNYEVIEADDDNKALIAAYEAFKEDAESNGDWEAKPLTKELAEEHGFENELEETDGD